MAIFTIVVGSMLNVLGILAYLLTGATSLTALIPVAFGGVLELCGALAMRPHLRKAAMHAAVVVALLGFAGSVRGLTKIGGVIAGEAVERPAAVISQSIMAAITGIFVLACLKSFADARRSRAS